MERDTITAEAPIFTLEDICEPEIMALGSVFNPFPLQATSGIEVHAKYQEHDGLNTTLMIRYTLTGNVYRVELPLEVSVDTIVKPFRLQRNEIGPNDISSWFPLSNFYMRVIVPKMIKDTLANGDSSFSRAIEMALHLVRIRTDAPGLFLVFVDEAFKALYRDDWRLAIAIINHGPLVARYLPSSLTDYALYEAIKKHVIEDLGEAFIPTLKEDIKSSNIRIDIGQSIWSYTVHTISLLAYSSAIKQYWNHPLARQHLLKAINAASSGMEIEYRRIEVHTPLNRKNYAQHVVDTLLLPTRINKIAKTSK